MVIAVAVGYNTALAIVDDHRLLEVTHYPIDTPYTHDGGLGPLGLPGKLGYREPLNDDPRNAPAHKPADTIPCVIRCITVTPDIRTLKHYSQDTFMVVVMPHIETVMTRKRDLEWVFTPNTMDPVENQDQPDAETTRAIDQSLADVNTNFPPVNEFGPITAFAERKRFRIIVTHSGVFIRIAHKRWVRI
jgi:hypothetical protein